MEPTVLDRIEKLLAEDGLTSWESNFLSSVAKQFEKKNQLSHNQNTVLQKIESKYSEEQKAARKKFDSEYTDEKRRNMRIMAMYYNNNPPYFGDVVARVLEDPEFVPTEKQYKAMCTNKYAARVISTANAEPLFPTGTMVKLRSGIKFRSTARRHYRAAALKNVMALVLEHPEEVVSPAKDAKPVRVLLVGSNDILETEERYLKKLKKSS